MSHPVLAAVEERAEEIVTAASSNERLGKLDTGAVKVLRETGVIKMLQPVEYGGTEAHPAEFAETVMKVASYDGSTGWVAGIVGVHPWEMAMADAGVREEIWGEDTDTWIASPYAPLGVLKPTDGGYIFSGRWQFSTGTDHCDWIFLGGFLGDEEGNVVRPLVSYHVILPRSDYEIVEDAFVPSCRVIPFSAMLDGSAPREAGLENPTYHVPFTTIFPLGITSAVIGICEGALAHHMAYQQKRVQITGTKIKDDPYVLYAISAAADEINASRVAMLDNVCRIYDKVAAGKEISFRDRAVSRRTQVAAAWRAVRGMDEIVARSGGNGLRMDNPIQRFWRDGHMGMAHAIHVPGAVFHASALTELDIDPPEGPLRSMI